MYNIKAVMKVIKFNLFLVGLFMVSSFFFYSEFETEPTFPEHIAWHSPANYRSG